MQPQVDIQIACRPAPDESIQAQFNTWVAAALSAARSQGVSIAESPEVTIRVVAQDESQDLNSTYRGKDKPTNVLSFPFEQPPGLELPILGDLAVCHDVVCEEAKQQNKTVAQHWAHMIIHGTLHLMGYDHINDEDAEQMERLEVEILNNLGIDDPYVDNQS